MEITGRDKEGGRGEFRWFLRQCTEVGSTGNTEQVRETTDLVWNFKMRCVKDTKKGPVASLMASFEVLRRGLYRTTSLSIINIHLK